ncbi:thymidine phosphorylase [Caulobacter ginsengisoli]|uniref:Thymidine phosphorylase n=1 Tax=Caulobacter ginsengisoli TaxID=400775 RepID=A0ABU0IN38_9CAUL|nr:thymidine phosphorylase [Caulobacter ginsengisoli]MDQ0463419.1 thymidine phosphorylase [Caulobacter ginsengisoli]
MNVRELIAHKRDGAALSDEEIGFFVKGLADGSIPSEQASALAMAVYFQGMSFAETAALTGAMARSGEVMEWAGLLDGPVVDKHSTGGIGDKVSLMLAPIAAACGAFVPMLSGRGLGHTGGTLDKMEAIPGYNATPDSATFRKVVAEVGCAIIGQTGQLAPADGRLYAIRDLTGTVESIPLITASILSKKIAAGVGSLVMDIKTGSGAFMATTERAEALARSLIGTGAAAGMTIHALITDMDEPLGRTAGNGLEVAETLAYLRNEDREHRLDAVVMGLAAEMLVVSGLAVDAVVGKALAEDALVSGKAAEIFARMVKALGGPGDLMENQDRYLAKAPVVRPVFARAAGYISSVNARDVGNIIIDLGGGRGRVEDDIDPSVGFSDIAPVGSAVGPDRPLATVHAANDAAAEEASEKLRNAYMIGQTPPAPRAVLHDLITRA